LGRAGLVARQGGRMRTLAIALLLFCASAFFIACAIAVNH
jgi:hypothetical protein